jgi:murein DD-endopeptidase MepM/ murein hydrolase activator NlpD
VVAAGREARRERQDRRGPVHPLAVEPDYGTAENAFGAARSGHMHAGQDVFAPTGSPLVAVSEGEVVEAGSDGSQGNYVYLYDPREDRTYVYMHMVAPPAVKTGDRVSAGQNLGGVGCTGSCWGDHLHFEVHAGRGIEGQAQDPLPLLQSWPRAKR